ncbi:MAG TPA: RagB/SusD family nutrient uptake outer membrane protein [Chitinophagaceae bacterium]|nr:RagB/SusD family nutrient uptake outer membrane protein [Chitinophagaceae bacterium]
MKNKLIYIVSLLSLVPFASCKKSYLDKKPPNALVLSDAIKSESDLLVALAGTYASLRNTSLYGRTLPVKGDLMADNTYVTTSNSGRYLPENNFAFTSTDGDAGGVWTAAYSAIKNANTVINAGLNSTANVNQYVGEALAIRALMHFELVRNFATPYTVDPTKPGVPIVTSFDQNAQYSRPTVQQDYTQIIKDLEQAYSLMTL